MLNPYRPNSTDELGGVGHRYVHPDWKWMTWISYGCCCLVLLVIVGAFESPLNRPVDVKLRFLPEGTSVGFRVYLCLIPLFSVFPTAVVSLGFRYFYSRISKHTRTTEWNYLFLICAFLAAWMMAMLLRPVQ